MATGSRSRGGSDRWFSGWLRECDEPGLESASCWLAGGSRTILTIERGMEVTEADLRMFFQGLLPAMDERQRRLVAGAVARMLGRGNVGRVAEAAGMSRNTVIGGIEDIESGPQPPGRVRARGAGRKQLVESEPGLLAALDWLIEPCGGTDPASPLRWTEKSTVKLADALGSVGLHVSADTVGRLLKATGYHLQPPLSETAGAQAPVEGQLRDIIEETSARLSAGEPVVSVSMAKSVAKSTPEPGLATSLTPKLAETGGNGIHALGGAEGWHRVGNDGLAAALAIRSVRRWWETMGIDRHPGAQRLLIVPHAGSPTATRTWGVELNRFALDTGLDVTACPFPPATVRWRRIEHRLFSFVTDNRHDRPRSSYRAIVELCGGRTTTVLKERAELDEDRSPREVMVPAGAHQDAVT